MLLWEVRFYHFLIWWLFFNIWVILKIKIAHFWWSWQLFFMISSSLLVRDFNIDRAHLQKIKFFRDFVHFFRSRLTSPIYFSIITTNIKLFFIFEATFYLRRPLFFLDQATFNFLIFALSTKINLKKSQAHSTQKNQPLYFLTKIKIKEKDIYKHSTPTLNSITNSIAKKKYLLKSYRVCKRVRVEVGVFVLFILEVGEI